jgi:hypothetical protein
VRKRVHMAESGFQYLTSWGVGERRLRVNSSTSTSDQTRWPVFDEFSYKGYKI